MQAPAPSDAPATEADTRSRILTAAQRLFRKRGYHATGLNDVLELAQAPKGSLYHHFPGGKEAIGVCVVQDITRGLLGLLAQSRARSTAALLAQVGEQLAATMQRTDFEICTLFAAFAAERKSSPQLGLALADAYAALAGAIQSYLERDGMQARTAQDTAWTITALLEGGSLLSQAQQNADVFRLTVKQALKLCKFEPQEKEVK
jgi:TetR/AcrR family transcriptional regulator, lmrAB and yxaGH operons repressor